MDDLPTGIVTLFFTDIAGSTALWERHPHVMPAAYARHNAILRDSIESFGGVVFKTVGDAFCAAFTDAPAALAAALAAQRALCAEEWGVIGSLRVRIALHTSAVEMRDGDYFGPPLNRVARLLSAGHGGQTLLSLATQEQVCEHLPPGAELCDLGEHRLKDLIHPEHIFQFVAPGLPNDFPALRTGTNQTSEQRAWKQAKLPDMPGIDYDVVLEKDRQLNRRRRSRKKKTETGDLF